MNAYTFPDHIVISDQIKSLITKILQTDPNKRPGLDEILSHDFFNMGNSIPKLLPASTLACPPSNSYIKQFTGNSNIQVLANKKSNSIARFESTTPLNINELNQKQSLLQTEKINDK